MKMNKTHNDKAAVLYMKWLSTIHRIKVEIYV